MCGLDRRFSGGGRRRDRPRQKPFPGLQLFPRPPRFLQPGDVLTIEISNIGKLENRVIAEAEARGQTQLAEAGA